MSVNLHPARMMPTVQIWSMVTHVNVWQGGQGLTVKSTLMNVTLNHVRMEQTVQILSMDISAGKLIYLFLKTTSSCVAITASRMARNFYAV